MLDIVRPPLHWRSWELKGWAFLLVGEPFLHTLVQSSPLYTWAFDLRDWARYRIHITYMAMPTSWPCRPRISRDVNFCWVDPKSLGFELCFGLSRILLCWVPFPPSHLIWAWLLYTYSNYRGLGNQSNSLIFIASDESLSSSTIKIPNFASFKLSTWGIPA